MKYNEYLNNINLPEPLTKEETNKYFILVKNGDKQARNKLIAHNLKFAIYTINKQFGNLSDNFLFDFNDLMSIGTIGLIKAVDTFDIERGYSFLTYASRCINNEILMVLRKGKNKMFDVSIDEPIHLDKEGRKVTDITISDTLYSKEDITDSYDKYELKQAIQKSLNILSDIEKRVIELYYGLNSDPLPQKEIGKLLGHSQAYISRIDTRARKKLGVYLQHQGLGYIKSASKEQEDIKKMSPLNRGEYYANLIINTKISIKALAMKLKCNETTIYYYTKILKRDNPKLYKEYKETIENKGKNK